jgi:iron complex outermembrane receptor protein
MKDLSSSPMNRVRVATLAVGLLAVALPSHVARAQSATAPALEAPKVSIDPADAPRSGPGLSELSLEDLMNIEVLSVSRQRQRLGDSAAAVSVISADDIRRAGVTSIAELIRQAPGMQVAQSGAGTWVVGSRGLAHTYTNNLLVLVDGRTVYTPMFAGVFWDTVDYPLEDLERIEIVRGPGGTLWGSNAVNGVINILSKPARDTQGLLFQEYYGNDGDVGTVRYGGNVDNRVFYRVYSKYRTMDDFPDPTNPRIYDGWDAFRNGFRIDAELSPVDTFTLQGDLFDDRGGRPRSRYSLFPPFASESSEITNTNGGNLLTRYTHTFSDTSDLSVQLYYDKLQLQYLDTGFEQSTYDLEFQHRFALGDWNEIIWGAGYRLVSDNSAPLVPTTSLGNFFVPDSRDTSLLSGFIQDDITIVPKRLHAIVGTKLEMTPYTGFEFQPSVRLLFTPDTRNTLWASVSRAVRSPSRVEHDAHVFAGLVPMQPLPVAAGYIGNPNLESEQLLALESGYRTEPVSNLSFDLTGFLNFHHGVVETTPIAAPALSLDPVPHLELPIGPVNSGSGISYGAEIGSRWKVSDQFTLSASYSYLCVSLPSPIDDTGTFSLLTLDRTAPSHQAQLRASYDITKDIQVNAANYFVGTIDRPHVGSYFRTDLNVVWKLHQNVELQGGVRNLFDPEHPEFINQETRLTGSEVPRTFYLMITGRF